MYTIQQPTKSMRGGLAWLQGQRPLASGILAQEHRASTSELFFGFRIAVACAALASSLTAATPARAAVSAFSRQSTSGYQLYTAGTLGAFTADTHTATSAAQSGTPTGIEAHVGVADALQSYVGPAAGRPREGFFQRKGETTPDYSRADSEINTAGPLTNGMAELYLASVGDASATGTWSITAPLTLTSRGTVDFAWNFTNEWWLSNTGNGTAEARYSFHISIEDSHYTQTWMSESPIPVNYRVVKSTGNGFESSTVTGGYFVTSPTLQAGEYLITVSGEESVYGSIAPEPASLAVIGCGCFGLRRRRRLRRGVNAKP